MTSESNRMFDAQVAMIDSKTDCSRNESLFSDEKPKVINRNNPALARIGSITRQSCVDTLELGL